MTDADVAYHALVERLRGRQVTSVRIFLFTLQIYLASHNADDRNLEIWCEPNWHVRIGVRIVTGSGAIEAPSTFDDAAEVERASATIRCASDAAQVLVGKVLTSVHVDPVTYALVASFDDGIVVATVMDDPDISTAWVLRDPHLAMAVRGTPLGMMIGIREPRK
ncbi:MAG: hypothetical protein ABI969_02580 [bacterium]